MDLCASSTRCHGTGTAVIEDSGSLKIHVVTLELWTYVPVVLDARVCTRIR